MTRLALLTALALSASSFAYADPPYDRDRDRDRLGDRDRRGDRYDQRTDWERDHYNRYDNSRWNRDFRGRWVPLAERYSTQSSRQAINLRGEGGRFRQLRIESVRGTPLIHQIAIDYVNDPNTQVVKLNIRLPRGAGEVVRLNGDRRIKRIIVYVDPRYGGQYSIYGA